MIKLRIEKKRRNVSLEKEKKRYESTYAPLPFNYCFENWYYIIIYCISTKRLVPAYSVNTTVSRFFFSLSFLSLPRRCESTSHDNWNKIAAGNIFFFFSWTLRWLIQELISILNPVSINDWSNPSRRGTRLKRVSRWIGFAP